MPMRIIEIYIYNKLDCPHYSALLSRDAFIREESIKCLECDRSALANEISNVYSAKNAMIFMLSFSVKYTYARTCVSTHAHTPHTYIVFL